MERHSGEGQPERYAELARNVVNTHPDLILAVGARLSLDFKMATTTIPIVTVIIDPIAMGLVASIARPGGNITGVTIAAGLELIGKRMELLVEVMPKLFTVGYLVSRPYWEDPRGAAAREAAERTGISLKAALLESTSASSDRWNRIERLRSWYLMKPSTLPILRRLSNWPRKAGFPQCILPRIRRGWGTDGFFD